MQTPVLPVLMSSSKIEKWHVSNCPGVRKRSKAQKRVPASRLQIPIEERPLQRQSDNNPKVIFLVILSHSPYLIVHLYLKIMKNYDMMTCLIKKSFKKL